MSLLRIRRLRVALIASGVFAASTTMEKHSVARTEGAAQQIQDAAVVKALEQVIPGKQSLSVLQRRVLQSGPQLRAGIARREF